jgi:predicted esterase
MNVRKGALLEIGLLLPSLLLHVPAPVASAFCHSPGAMHTQGGEDVKSMVSSSSSPSSTAVSAGDVLPKRILALHGFAQTASFFRQKTGSMRKGVKGVEFVYIDAPCLCTHPTIGAGKSWYEFSEKGEEGKLMEWGKFEETVEYIERVFQEQGPFDGVLGFSQGACVVGVLCGMLETGALPAGIKFDFAVLISGFLPRDSRYRSICAPDQQIKKVRSLHVVGKTDDIVEATRSLKLADLFQNPIVVQHEKGHMVPSDKHVRDALKDFLNK